MKIFPTIFEKSKNFKILYAVLKNITIDITITKTPKLKNIEEVKKRNELVNLRKKRYKDIIIIIVS